jgi:GNAT superfamily N-acetyltransferase|tara:strand:- start:1198 stop:1623 length:426 start_codon:yes stop_codon:yes gene_type:complete
LFKDHHYLSGNLPPASRKYVATWNGNVVGFVATMTMPSGTMKNAWRESRLVVLPDYQGLGIGMRLSNAVAELHLADGKRYFSRTAHPRMGFYREGSDLWRPTSKNRKLRKDITHDNVFKGHYADNKRVCFSHEYMGHLVKQ